ncbi:hypothetical protein QAD02_018237 [Eretmocerus hayati]|uniref:Uncharacterized protein n=1 Tax=Eretmocerus hayati TaxID=131215 RepID=A0ACC2PG99_9HYME|nr:hypothetical protein QAD02_018237 [Eretmocerus hayati]
MIHLYERKQSARMTPSSTPDPEDVVIGEFAEASESSGESHHLSDLSILSLVDGAGTELATSSATNPNGGTTELDSSLNYGMDTSGLLTDSPIDPDQETNVMGPNSLPPSDSEKDLTIPIPLSSSDSDGDLPSCDSSLAADDSDVDDPCSELTTSTINDECVSDGDEDGIDEDSDTTNSQESVLADIPLYKDSPHTLEYATHLLAEWFVQSKTAKKWMDGLVKIFKKLLPRENNFPSSGWKFLDTVKSYAPEDETTRHYYCRDCGAKFGDVRLLDNHCQTCSSNKGYGFFTEFDIAKQIKFMFEYRNLGKLLLSRPQCHRDKGLICDINDGSEFIRSNGVFGEKGLYDLTLVSFLDGFNYSNSSIANVWPYYYTIAELPEHLRELFITVGAIWADDIKPKMNSYMEPTCIKIKQCFAEGIKWTDPDTKIEHTTRVIAPEIIADKPARSELANQMHHNSRYGCETCEIRTIRCAAVLGKKRKRIYPFLEQEARARTKNRMFKQAKKAEQLFKNAKKSTKTRINVKGLTSVSVIEMLPGLDLSTCFFPECLHALCLGGTRTIVGVQVNTTFKGSFKGHLDYINDQLKSIRPPNIVQRIPQNITNWRRMKGHELLDWLLIYSTPILQEVLKDRQEYFQHWILLVISTHTLFKRQIKVDEVKQAKILLNMFGRDIESLYGDRLLTYYMHQLTKHLADYVEKWGPAWANSAFPYESFNSFLASFIHGTNNVNQELVNNIRIYEGHLALKSKFVEPVLPKELEFRFKMLGRPIDLEAADVTNGFLQEIVDSTNALNNVKDKSLRKAQIALNQRTRGLVFDNSADDSHDESHYSLSQSESSDDEIQNPMAKKRRLDESQDGKERDIAALIMLRPTIANSDQSHPSSDSAMKCSTQDNNRVDVLPTQKDPATSSLKKNGLKRGQKENRDASRLASNEAGRGRNPSYNHEQLFGQGCGVQMHPIGDGVLCKVDIVRTAIKAQNARECSRQLLTGVFKLGAILNCSLNGRNKSGPFVETPQQKFLSGRAIQAIVSYAQKQARKRNWPTMTEVVIRRGISKKLWQIRDSLKKSLRNNKTFIYGGEKYDVREDSN